MPSVGTGSALVYEAVLTAFLMFVIIAVATDTRAVGAAAAIAIGGTVGLDALFGGPITGASMNPRARSARRSSRVSWTDFWIYLVGPVVGAALGAFAYQLVRGPQPHAGGRLMAHVALRLPPQRRPLADEPRRSSSRAAGGRHEARSAGTEPAERVHPEVIEAMAELGIDLARPGARKLARHRDAPSGPTWS